MENNEKHTFSDYWPLVSLVMIAALSALALQANQAYTLTYWMHYFMGIFLVIFATLKIFDIPGFADGFSMYDLLAKKYRGYAYCYPLIELLLGLAYLSFAFPTATYVATIIVMGFGSIGVITALRAGLKINCPCMGNILKVPLSTVTLTEDLAMGIMALIMLLMS